MKTAPFAIAAAVALSLGMAAPSYAGQVRVSYADLDLTTKSGQDQLERRLEAAAREACNYDKIPTGTRLRSSDVRKCYSEARSQASAHLARILEKEGLGG
ncbi:MAG: UrcA family protein [Novosphingobium sp.]|nr:UrcA family protein [Novosphingobium sp.]